MRRTFDHRKKILQKNVEYYVKKEGDYYLLKNFKLKLSESGEDYSLLDTLDKGYLRITGNSSNNKWVEIVREQSGDFVIAKPVLFDNRKLVSKDTRLSVLAEFPDNTGNIIAHLESLTLNIDDEIDDDDQASPYPFIQWIPTELNNSLIRIEVADQAAYPGITIWVNEEIESEIATLINDNDKETYHLIFEQCIERACRYFIFKNQRFGETEDSQANQAWSGLCEQAGINPYDDFDNDDTDDEKEETVIEWVNKIMNIKMYGNFKILLHSLNTENEEEDLVL